MTTLFPPTRQLLVAEQSVVVVGDAVSDRSIIIFGLVAIEDGGLNCEQVGKEMSINPRTAE